MGERTERVYVLEVAGRPTFAFAAISWGEAKELSREDWVKNDLSELTSQGVPLWSVGSAMSVRQATADEASHFAAGQKQAEATVELTLVYLVELDS